MTVRATSLDPQQVQTRAVDGWLLRGELRLPAGEPLAVAVLGHAMMVDRRTMDRPPGGGLASALTAAGIAVLCFDLRGHGQSGPGATQGASWSYDDLVRGDLPALVRLGRRRFPGLSLALVGHSLTGHAALIQAGLQPEAAPDAVVALGANLWLPWLEPRPDLKLLKGGALLLWSAITWSMGSFEARRLRMGTDAEAWPYVRQFLQMYLSGRASSPDGRTDYAQALSRVQLPVLSICSRGDRLLARPGAVARFNALMPRARLEQRVIEGPDAPDHMGLVTSARSRPIWDQVARWVLGLPGV